MGRGVRRWVRRWVKEWRMASSVGMVGNCGELIMIWGVVLPITTTMRIRSACRG